MADENQFFQGLKLDKDSPVPAYFQIKNHIEQLIAQKKLQPGDRLPSERDFCEALPVSRMTYRQALTTLKHSGLLVQQQGRGTFVAPQKVGLATMEVLSFSEAMSGQGLIPGARTLKKRVYKPAPAEMADEMGISPDSGVLTLVRIRTLGNVPMLLETSWLDASRFGALMHTDLTDRSLYHILETQFNTVIMRRREIIDALPADDKLGKLLNVEQGSPLIRNIGHNYGGDGRLVEYVVSYYRADKARFSFETTRKQE
jgi:GntR family transcriptional regulator